MIMECGVMETRNKKYEAIVKNSILYLEDVYNKKIPPMKFRIGNNEFKVKKLEEMK